MDPRTPTYDQLSALCAQMAAAMEPIADVVGEGAEDFPDDTAVTITFGRSTYYAITLGNLRAVSAALTAYRTLSPDPQWQRVPDMARELTALKEAVTPSAGTKAAYIGEFSFNHVVRDENGDEDYEPITVPWTTIKEIMAAISNRARGEG